MSYLKYMLAVIALTFTLASGPLHLVTADEIEEAPVDESISEICTPSDCSLAKPCIEKGESCYAVNGIRYCCVQPPSGGAEAIGE